MRSHVFLKHFILLPQGEKRVLIDVPIDVQNASISRFKYPEEVNLRTYKPAVKAMWQIQKVIKKSWKRQSGLSSVQAAAYF